MRNLLSSCLITASLFAAPALAQAPDIQTLAIEASDPWPADAAPVPALPRYREEGTPFDSAQRLVPFAVERQLRDAPGSMVSSPPEYSPTRGVLYSYVTGQWTSIVTQMVKELTNDPNCPTCDEIAYVVVPSTSVENAARTAFIGAGANMSKVKFLQMPLDALWIRDYGPHFIWQEGTLALLDSHYYPGRPLDNFVPTQIGDDYQLDANFPSVRVPTYDQPLYYSGGNFQPGPNRTGFMSSLVNVDNPSSQGFTADLIAEIFSKYAGVDTLHILPQLPTSVDGTGHIDMWMYLVDEDDVIIGEFKPGSNATAITITNNAVPYMQALGFTVHRTPSWNVGSTHYTYTNAYRVNNRIFTIKYNAYPTDNAAALAAFQAAAGPGVLLNPIECTSIIPAAGAIHCIVMQVPRRTEPLPAAYIISPAGRELLVSGTTHTIAWAVTDENNRLIPTVDLYYTYDGGATWQFIATTPNTGSYNWTVPTLASQIAKVKVVATSLDSDVAEATSTEFFEISPATQTRYDFASGAGTDKFAYGTQSSSWSAVNALRQPVFNPLTAANYARLATSNATGGDSDANRYIAPSPSTNFESTHTFEFNLIENPAQLAKIDVVWEGYGANCTQVELYVWDYVQGRWGDGAGVDPNTNYGQNRFVDNWAGNRDGTLEGTFSDTISRLVSGTGQMTFLVYAERGSTSSQTMPTFHDYVAVTTTTTPAPCLGDMDCDGDVDFMDIDYFVAALGGDAAFMAAHVANLGTPPTCLRLNGDIDGDDNVTFFDIDGFVGLLGTTCP